jgi:enoyl-CoA hydratase/carnithine racemase
MPDSWRKLEEWPDVYLERLDDAGVARIVWNKPEKRNSLTREMMDGAFAALDIIRADPELKVVITKGAGPVYSSGLNLNFLRSQSHGYNKGRDWDRPGPTIEFTVALRDFPRITIAQVHGYCLGGAFGLMNIHDLIIAADDAQIGMPEIPRGSFGQIATSTLFHAGIPIKKASLLALTAKNFSGREADQAGLVSMSVPPGELESTTNRIAREIASRHLAPLQHHKIAVQLGRDLPLGTALRIDQLVGARQSLYIDPVAHVDDYLKSQKGGPNFSTDGYKRPDVE